MIDPNIQTYYDGKKKWLVMWRRANGSIGWQEFADRLSMHQFAPTIYSEVKGVPFPTISMKPDETITIGAPKRRAGDA